MPRTANTICTWLALVSAGCASTGPAPSGSSVVVSRPDAVPEVLPAPADAVYTLSRTGDWLRRDSVVVLRRLAAGDAVGFEREGDGSRVAVAGDFRKSLPDGRYRWHVTPAESGRPDRLAGADAKLAAASRSYMDALEPVTKAVAVAALAPIILFLVVFRIPLPFS